METARIRPRCKCADVGARDDFIFMKLVQEIGGHIAAHGQSEILFLQIRDKLYNFGRLPWKTDSKHFHELFELFPTK